MARSASAQGFEVSVLATWASGLPQQEKWHDVEIRRLIWKTNDILNESRFYHKMPAWIRWALRKAINKCRPRLKYWLFDRIFRYQAIKFRPDIIHAHDLITLRTACKAARACGAKYVYDSHELELDRYPALLPYAFKAAAREETMYGSNADAVITVGQHIKEYIEDRLKRSDVHVLYNAPLSTSHSRRLRDELGFSERDFLILYVGKVTFGRGLEQAVERLSCMEDAHLLTLGHADPKFKKQLADKAFLLNVADRVRQIEPVHHDDVVDYIKGANVGIIGVQALSISYKYCMPNKLFELSAADVPIIANKLPEINQFITKLGNGIVVDFDDDAEFFAAVTRIRAEPSKYTMTGKKRTFFQETYSWEAQEVKLIRLYQSLTQ